MIDALIISDSQGPTSRLTTFVLTYPRFIHAELLTHRNFSRNSASSRAIPIAKMIRAVQENPAEPVFWGQNQPGMQAQAQLPEDQIVLARAMWLQAAQSASTYAEHLSTLGVHKQIANRVIEPFLHMTAMVTATDWENFFSLRAHADAQPEFASLAYTMLEAYLTSRPNLLSVGDWHIPFGDQLPEGTSLSNRLKVATARAARISYVSFDAPVDIEKDVALHDKLTASGHWSPTEHSAQATGDSHYSGNFRGWRQYRKTFPYENRTADLPAILAARPSHL